jgi:hypothetical protein
MPRCAMRDASPPAVPGAPPARNAAVVSAGSGWLITHATISAYAIESGRRLSSASVLVPLARQ